MEGPPKDRPPATEALFDTGASTYDTYVNEQGFWESNRQVLKVFDIINPRQIKTALDLGAGTGMTIEAVQQQVQPNRTVAVDLSANMLTELKAKKLPDVEAVHDDMVRYVDNCSEKFDLVTAISCLEFVPDLPNFLAKVVRLIESGGTLVITYIPTAGEPASRIVPSSQGSAEEFVWPPDDIRSILESSDLKVRYEKPFHPYSRNSATILYNLVIAVNPEA